MSAGGDEFGGGINDELGEPARVSQGEGGTIVRRRVGPTKGSLPKLPSCASTAFAFVGGTSTARRGRHGRRQTSSVEWKRIWRERERKWTVERESGEIGFLCGK